VRAPKLYSYVVEHDNGHAPNPYFGVCTLCRCKFRDGPRKPKNVVELAEQGDWIVGTGGANARKSAGYGTLVYAMRVDEKLRRDEYFADLRFRNKRPLTTGAYARTRGDNSRPSNQFEKRDQFALISRHFYYFGANATRIPDGFADVEKKGPGFKKHFDSAYVARFVRWLEQNHKPGKHGEPCQREVEKRKGCTLSC
jgi:Nucleotide modification associated domain 2